MQNQNFLLIIKPKLRSMSQTLWSKKNSAKQRRLSVINRLEEQLKSNTKVTKECKAGEFVLLLDSDRNRIEKELQTLKSRI